MAIAPSGSPKFGDVTSFQTIQFVLLPQFKTVEEQKISKGSVGMNSIQIVTIG